MKQKNILVLKKGFLIFALLLAIFQSVYVFGLPVHATEPVSTESDGGALKETKLYTGTMKLIADATKIAILIEGVLCGFLVVVEFIKMQQADEQEKPRHKKNIKAIIISGVIIMTITGILTAVFSYYK